MLAVVLFVFAAVGLMLFPDTLVKRFWSLFQTKEAKERDQIAKATIVVEQSQAADTSPWAAAGPVDVNPNQ
jgi:hypothetical protein